MPIGVTINQQPQLYMPAGNPHLWTFSSTNEALPGHQFKVLVMDVITTEALVYDIPSTPIGGAFFDSSTYAKARVDNYIPSTGGAMLTGWRTATGIRQIKVSIGEEWTGQTPLFLADIFYYTWNGCLGTRAFSTYNYTDFVFNLGAARYRHFNGPVYDTAYLDRSNLIYVLSEPSQGITGITITTINAAGAVIASTPFLNSTSASANYRDQYRCIDVGPKGLGGIITAATVRYTVTANSVLIKDFSLNCAARYIPITVHYLARNGAFLSCNFDLISEPKQNRSETTFQQNPLVYDGTNYGYTPDSSQTKALQVATQDVIKLNSNWITDEQVTVYEGLFSSPLCYIQDADSRMRAVRLVTNSYSKLPHYEKQLFQLNMDFEFCYQNYSQQP